MAGGRRGGLTPPLGEASVLAFPSFGCSMNVSVRPFIGVGV